MYATPARDKNGNKIALELPCNGDGTLPVGPERCGLTMWYSHDSDVEPDGTVHRYASFDNKHSWLYAGTASDGSAIDIDGGVLGHFEEDSAGKSFFKKKGPTATIVVQVMPRRGW